MYTAISGQIRSDQIRSDQIRSDQIRSDQIRSEQHIGMRCNVGSSYKYVHMTVHSHAPNDYDKLYYYFKLNKKEQSHTIGPNKTLFFIMRYQILRCVPRALYNSFIGQLNTISPSLLLFFRCCQQSPISHYDVNQ